MFIMYHQWKQPQKPKMNGLISNFNFRQQCYEEWWRLINRSNQQWNTFRKLNHLYWWRTLYQYESNDWLLNHQSHVSQCSNADVSFSYVQDVKPENSEATSQEACDVTLQEPQKIAPNQKVNVCATLSMGTKEPKKIETKSGQTLTVKEDCILQDGSDTMEIHIWEPVFAQPMNNKAYYFKNLTLQYYAGSKFLSTNKNTSHTEDSMTLQKLVGPEMLTNPDRDCCKWSEIHFQLKHISCLSNLQKTALGMSQENQLDAKTVKCNNELKTANVKNL